jgi:hypothetical protein
MATDKFKFPDEIDGSVEISVDGDNLEVVVEDDAPPEDRNVDPLPEEITKDLEKADESEDYSQNVKTKFKQYKKAWHDERRLKESALREQNEALVAAQQILDENRRLKSMLHTGEKELISTYQNSAEMELEKAKTSYREAYDTGDTDKLMDAQQEVIAATMKLDKAKNFRPTVQTEDNDVKTQQRVAQQPQMDPKVAQWVARNPWYVDPSKKSMNRYAVGVHEELVDRYGAAFVGTDEYFTGIDKEVKRRFPEEFADTRNEVEKPSRTRSSTVVAPASRSTSSKRVVNITASAAAIAKKLGVTPEQYVREMTKLEA